VCDTVLSSALWRRRRRRTGAPLLPSKAKALMTREKEEGPSFGLHGI
jgi:hypothetical protein